MCTGFHLETSLCGGVPAYIHRFDVKKYNGQDIENISAAGCPWLVKGTAVDYVGYFFAYRHAK